MKLLLMMLESAHTERERRRESVRCCGGESEDHLQERERERGGRESERGKEKKKVVASMLNLCMNLFVALYRRIPEDSATLEGKARMTVLYLRVHS
jgi:hypothetical protein